MHCKVLACLYHRICKFKTTVDLQFHLRWNVALQQRTFRLLTYKYVKIHLPLKEGTDKTQFYCTIFTPCEALATGDWQLATILASGICHLTAICYLLATGNWLLPFYYACDTI